MAAARSALDPRLAEFLRATPDAMVAVDGAGRILGASGMAERMFGYAQGELAGREVELLVPERLREAHVRHRARFMKRPHMRPMGAAISVSVLRKDGSEFSAEIVLSPLWTEAGTVVLAGVRDISARRIAEDQSRRERDLNDALLRAQSELGDGVAIFERGRFAYANDALCALCGRPREQLLGLFFTEAVVPEEREALLAVARRRAATGDPLEPGEVTVLRPDGARVPAEYAITGLANGERRDVAIVRDVTARKRAEEARLAAAARAREAEHLRDLLRFRTEFLSITAHEVNTPLTPMKLQLDMLRAREMGEDERRALELLGRNLDRLERLAGDLLRAARLQADRLSLKRGPVDLDRLVLQAADGYRAVAGQAGIELEVAAEPARIEADERLLAQVLDNLVSNAVKFTPRGGRILVELRASPQEARVTVRDTGIGLRPEDLARLFQPFSRVRREGEPAQPGTGLGLYITKGIVDLHGGRVWAESEGPGKGSAFAFALPAGPAAREAPAAPEAQGTGSER